ncbi:hypothetical protein [Nocardia sp. NRRL S-836]|nr:hypothetical protein [Nocardia sp. NRRL S-836]
MVKRPSAASGSHINDDERLRIVSVFAMVMIMMATAFALLP